MAVSRSFVFGAAGAIEALPSTGVAFVPVTVCVPRADGLVPPLPSTAVTSTSIVSPLSPLPASARSSVAFVAPLIGVPLRSHW